MKKKVRKITKANITHISFVPKGANGADFLIVKEDGITPNLYAESPLLKVDAGRHLVTGVVYAPDVVDSQGEFMEADAIEEAAHDFMAKSRHTDVRHNFVTNEGVSVVESYVAKADTQIGDQPIAQGTWLITAKVNDDQLWNEVANGVYKGFSMGGTGIREEVEVNAEEKKDDKGLFAVLKDFFGGGGEPTDVEKESANIEPVGKAGKSISSANERKIRDAYASLGALIALMDKSESPAGAESEGDMTKEELQAVLREAIRPLEKRLDALEEEIQPSATAEGDAAAKESLAEIVKEAVAPLAARLDKVEKARGGSRQMEEQTVIKSAGAFASVDI